VEFRGRDRWHNLWVYVDSGASLSILHTYEARRLGVSLRGCRKFYIVVAGDRRIPVFVKNLKMRLGRRVVTVEVGFCSALGGAFNLLGRKGVFDKFRVCFDDKKEMVSFQ